MYTFPSASDYNNTNSMSYDDVLPPHVLSSAEAIPLPPPPTHFLASYDQHQLAEVESASNMTNSTYSSSSSGCSTYGSPSYSTIQRPSLMQRSISSHSLQKNNGFHRFANDFLDVDSSPVRRIFSTGDLHRINMGHYYGQRSGSPLASECSIIIEGMNRACPYSPDEKKERIERYRSKRTQRNFNKRIKYACRKTLADRRARVRGRFARNEEIEKNPEVQWNHVAGEEDDGNWIRYLDSVSLANPFS